MIIDRKKGEVLFGKRETETRQIASLTKIMTAYCVMNLVDNQGPTDLNSAFCDMNSQVLILKPVSQLEGTSAKLLEGDSLSVMNLIYGMMLPSGNDAAQALGVYFGSLLLSNGKTDPNKDMVLCPLAVARRCKQLKIQAGFEFCKSKILKRRAEIKAEKALLKEQRLQELLEL